METEQIVDLSPDQINPGPNIRHANKNVEALMEDIREQGGVHTPIVVEPEGADGKYQLKTGFRRLEAVIRLNKEQQAGLTIPAFVRASATGLERLKAQISENIQREQLSLMDMAHTIERLTNEGVTKGEIRRIFSLPRGPKLKMEPASNAKINMIHSFLGLPKPIQAKIHNGLIPIGTAYELTKVDKDKQEAVLKAAEEERLKAESRDDKEEERYLNAEKRAKELTDKAAAEKLLKEAVALDVEDAKKLVEAKKQAVRDATEATLTATDKRVAAEALNASIADLKGAEKQVDKKEKELKRLSGEHKKSSDVAEGLKTKLENLRKNKSKAKPAKVQPDDVKTAARLVTGDSKPVALKLPEINALLKEMSGAGSFIKVQQIGKLFRSAFDGVLTPKELSKELAYLVGDAKRPTVAKQ